MVFCVWPLGAALLPLIFVMQFFWSAGIAGFPSVQQSRFVAIAPTLASATIALNSSVGYLGNSMGTAAGGRLWGLVGARFLPWAALVLMLASIGFSWLSDRAARTIANSDASVG
jgi:predicted MFS family arabinose efflux permease